MIYSFLKLVSCCWVYSLLCLVMLCRAAPAQTVAIDEDPAQLINNANQLVREGKVEKAIELYDRISVEKSGQHQLDYNRAVASYRKGEIDAASSLFSRAASSNDSVLAARSRYNLGNCRYASALELAEKNKDQAIAKLREAITHYRSSLKSISDNSDARANIELAAQLIKQLEKQKEEQQKDQSKNQDQDNQDQDKQDQDKPSENQPDEDQQSNAGQEQSEQNQKDEMADESNESQSNESQSNESQSNESQSNESQTQQNQPNPEAPSPQLGKNENPQSQSDQQKSDSDQQSESGRADDDQANENQPVSSGQLTADEKNMAASEGAAGSSADQNEKSGLMTQVEALKMLQAVRDRDMLRRMQQQQERTRRVPVDRDW